MASSPNKDEAQSSAPTCARTCEACGGSVLADRNMPALSRRKFLSKGARLSGAVAALGAFPGLMRTGALTARFTKRTAVVKTSKIAVGGAYAFKDPYTQVAGFIVQPTKGKFKAFSRICPHAGCTVNYASHTFVCPCHGSEFNGSTGTVIHGPATHPLTAISITESNGQVYVEPS